MGKVSVDVGEQVAHDGGHTRTHVFGRQTGEVPGAGEQRQEFFDVAFIYLFFLSTKQNHPKVH